MVGTQFYQHGDSERSGSIRLHTEQATRKKPVWLVTIKCLCLIAMVAVGYALVLPSFPMPLWQSMAATTGILLLYVGIAFYVRPDPNTHNMGWAGGAMNDPTKFSDNVNRWLWQLHCMLGPGRFVAETMIDAGTLLGIIPEVSEEDLAAERAAQAAASLQTEAMKRKQELAEKIEKRQQAQDYGQHSQELASAKFLDPSRFEE